MQPASACQNRLPGTGRDGCSPPPPPPPRPASGAARPSWWWKTDGGGDQGHRQGAHPSTDHAPQVFRRLSHGAVQEPREVYCEDPARVAAVRLRRHLPQDAARQLLP
ncbi:hypothetical protein DIPPA_02067 [Diplonema papillatum]|nr:hypothetical protein DIPPA_02067 [Diplonema papillatum]